MPVEILIHAFDHGKAKKGTPQTIKDDSDLSASPWGAREGLPNFVILRISDATKPDVVNYLSNWKREISFSMINSNAEGRRYELSINPKIISEFGMANGIKAEFRSYLEERYAAQVVYWDQSAGVARIDIPNTDWPALLIDVKEKFEQELSNRRYHFDPSDVDIVVAAGGFIEQTKAQALSRIIDRLA